MALSLVVLSTACWCSRRLYRTRHKSFLLRLLHRFQLKNIW